MTHTFYAIMTCIYIILHVKRCQTLRKQSILEGTNKPMTPKNLKIIDVHHDKTELNRIVVENLKALQADLSTNRT